MKPFVFLLLSLLWTPFTDANLRGSNNTGSTDLVQVTTANTTDSARHRNAAYCHTVTFTTSSQVRYAESQGSFYIEGYGFAPSYCKNKRGATCTLTICVNGNHFFVEAHTTNAWLYKVSQICDTPKLGYLDVTMQSRMTPWTQEPYPQHTTWMDRGQFDRAQKYFFKGVSLCWFPRAVLFLTNQVSFSTIAVWPMPHDSIQDDWQPPQCWIHWGLSNVLEQW